VPIGDNTRLWARAFIGLGSNLGERTSAIERSLAWLADHPEMRLHRQSEIIETEPWGVRDQPCFMNAVAEIGTRLEPLELLAELKRCERLLGRDRSKEPRWGPRVIDLDILLFEDLELSSEELTVPHPRLTERAFVLEQLVGLDPDLILPGTGRLLSSYLRVT
jgi:2-amino-4-hydroxy-6-hydroxymethyldihydropteridine diphosphokinase